MSRTRIAVIGAGAAGLPSLRHAILYENVDVICFEASAHLGGLWRYKPEETHESSVMKSTVMNTSKEMSAYSDFPPDPTTPIFMHNTEMYRYLNNYADHFGLRDFIKFNHKVLNVERSNSYHNDGTWLVTYLDQKGLEHKMVFDGVMMCSGHHSIPYIPEPWKGQEGFKGRVIHSHSYKDHKGFEDRVVVVVGIGSSGCDIAVELGKVAKKVYLVTRRGAWVLHRLFDHGKPFDMTLTRRSSFLLRQLLPESFSKGLLESELNRRFDHEQYGLKPDHRVFDSHPTINDELPNHIACGTIYIRRDIKQFVGEHGIIFLNENTTGNMDENVEHVDDLILATGFSIDFAKIEGGKLISTDDNKVEFYKNIFPLKTSDHNTLGMIGLVQPNGCILPVCEMQARVFLENLCGTKCLPSPSKMKLEIEMVRETRLKRYVNSRRHTIEVDFLEYMNDLSRLICCYPSITRLFFQSPYLAWKVFNGSAVSYHYRLFGPNTWKGAKNAIENAEERSFKATNNGCFQPKVNYWATVFLPICATAAAACAALSLYTF